LKKLILFFLLFCGSVRAEVVPTVYSEALDRFEVAYTGSGYMESSEFITFLDRAEGGVTEQSFYQKFSDDPVVFFEKWGLWYTILLILVGGLALNLTPCVLPMIPVNLAIIGAGVQSKSRKTGFMLGSVYGLGITLVYGILGLAVVLGGARFGTLNSSPWFNFSIALIFLILSLAMFDLFHIDLSRFQSKFGGRFSGHGYWAAFGGGALSALLAGACVAPVVIAVLLLASVPRLPDPGCLSCRSQEPGWTGSSGLSA